MVIKVWDENCRYRCSLRLATADIEEAICRCGWTVLNDAREVSPADRAEIDRLEKQDYISMTTQSGEEALKWWNDKKIIEVEVKRSCGN